MRFLYKPDSDTAVETRAGMFKQQKHKITEAFFQQFMPHALVSYSDLKSVTFLFTADVFSVRVS